jgi:cell division protein FtsB
MIDFDDIFIKKRFNYKTVLVIISAVVIALYIANLMLGKRSFSRLLDLQNSVEVLQKRVNELKKENENLQKEYFELKELEGNG